MTKPGELRRAPQLYEFGIEREDIPQRGWAVYSGCEGDSPTFRGYFPSRADAYAFASAFDASVKEPDEPERICFDPCVVAAIADTDGIWTANDYTFLENHAELASVVTAFKRAAGEGEGDG